MSYSRKSSKTTLESPSRIIDFTPKSIASIIPSIVARSFALNTSESPFNFTDLAATTPPYLSLIMALSPMALSLSNIAASVLIFTTDGGGQLHLCCRAREGK